jgi:DNA-binding MarR family transcriptional regulator/GNAT superfamily N-acetyltransferase
MNIPPDHIARVRAFNRDYTRRIGVLSEGLLDSPFSLTEVRVMYEIAHREAVTAGELAQELELDKGYLSRILKRFEAKKLLARRAAPEDARRQHLRLTPAGLRVFMPLEQRSQEQIRGLLAGLDDARRREVLEAMDVIQQAFTARKSEAGPEAGGRRKSGAAQEEGRAARKSGATPEEGRAASRSGAAPGETGADASGTAAAVARGVNATPVTLRSHRPGDMGWVVQRHGEIYHQEYGWNEEFEALVAEIAAEFIRKLDVARERCWIAEHAGRRVGCIFLVAKDAVTAKLRLLLVEPDARGLGVGRRLVAECVRFARDSGYQKIVLWTQSNLTAARGIYSKAGFLKTAEEPHHSFGYDLVGETWELNLAGA